MFEGGSWLPRPALRSPGPQILAAAASRASASSRPRGGRTAYAVLGASAQIVRATERRLTRCALLDTRWHSSLERARRCRIRLVNYRTFVEARPLDDFTRLHSAGLSVAADRRCAHRDADLYAASLPVFASTGEAIALLEARLPRERHRSPRSRSLVECLLVDRCSCWPRFASSRGVITRSHWSAAVRAAHGSRGAARPRRLLDVDPGRRARKEVGELARTMEDMRRNLVELTGGCGGARPRRRPCSAASSKASMPSTSQRVIRYLNPQAARLLGVQAHEAIGRFCGDVLKPCARGWRAAVRDTLPDRAGARAKAARRPPSSSILQRTARARTMIITSAAPVDGLQVQVHARRDRARRPCAARATRCSPIFRTSSARRSRRSSRRSSCCATASTAMPREQQQELVLVARARHAAADAAHRQPARKRAYRVRPARHPPAERVARGVIEDARRA